MSLFVCEVCGCVEDTNLVCNNIGYCDEAPNMHLMDMEGCGNGTLYVGKVMSYENKNQEDILMLCSECNTGKWHGKFTKEKALPVSLELAKTSIYNAITPYDHPRGSIVKNKNATGNNDKYRLATLDEVIAYSRKTQDKSKLARQLSYAAMNKLDISDIVSSKKINQSSSERKRMVMCAEYKRQWRQAKKDNDLDKVKLFKSKMDKIKKE